MLTFVSLILAVMAAILSIPIAVFFVEVVASLNSVSDPFLDGLAPDDGKRAFVIVPAHNESAGVIPTIEDIKPQLKSGDRLIVVADNCSDDTAAVAAAAGAEVIERNDLTQIGKGFALGWAIENVSFDPPDFVVFIDADCRIQSDMIQRLKQACARLQRPVQACFLMISPENSTIDHSVAEFTWLLRNWVRPLGLRYLDCPVQLMGTGMIFPWNVIRSAPLASGNLVEDLKLGMDLAAAGQAPHFFPFVIGSSVFPMSKQGTDTQRQRWVQGHLSLILTGIPKMLVTALARRNLDLLVLTLDLSVPPLSLLVLLIVSMLGMGSLIWLLDGSLAPVSIAAANTFVFVAAVSLAWLKFGRAVLPVRALLSIGPAMAKRIWLYQQILLGRAARGWVRTDRSRSD